MTTFWPNRQEWIIGGVSALVVVVAGLVVVLAMTVL